MPETGCRHRAYSLKHKLKLPRIISFTGFSGSDSWNRPVIPLLIALIFGILSGNTWPGKILFFSTIAILSTCWISLLVIRKQPSYFQPFLLFFCLGHLLIQPWNNQNLPSNHVLHHADSDKKIITGTIQETPISKHHRLQFILETETIGYGKNKIQVLGKLRVTLSGLIPSIRTGDRVALKGKIRPIRNFNNPGGFDYKRFMVFKGIQASVHAQGDQLQILERNQISGTLLFIESLREKISNHIDQSSYGEPRQILKALILGNCSGISDSLLESFNRSGVRHILDVSGLHIGIIASNSFLLLSTILSCFTLLLWKARVQKIAALLSIFPVLFYGVLAGMAPSTQRAVIMVITFLLTFPMEKEHDMINTISIAALLILIVFPPSLFSISFQLSFAAVLSIVYGLSKMELTNHEPRNRWQTFLQKIFLLFMVSFFATLGTMPIVLYYFNQISLIGIIGNLIAVPAIDLIVLPLEFLSIIILPACPALSSVCIQFCGFILSWSIEIIHILADLPFSAIKTITPNLFEIICFYALFWCVLNLIKQPMRSDPFTGKKTIQVLAGIISILLLADVIYWVNIRFFHDDLRIHILDVGQGNAALLEIPNGYTILIDGGGFSDNKSFDMGASVVAPFLWGKKIVTIDTIVLTHPNSDHMNGLIFIAQHFNVQNFWSTNEKSNSQSFLELQKIISEKKIHHPCFQELPTSQIINGVEIQILYPQKSFLFSGEKSGDLNNNSLVMKVTYKNRSFLFPGDLVAKGEKKLVQLHGHNLRSTVLLAPHHGSRTSSSEPFLSAVKPEYAIISSGWKNRFGMPHQAALDRYNALGCHIYRTDENGCVSMTTDGFSLQFVTQ
ncbi:MAG: DNA internalization-related competence protein ComEC/Rec2 [Desulfobacterium sp.]|nr:DNA internalization-related competence protein ComEC/Rec2 [Desulfobacterium sp.]